VQKPIHQFCKPIIDAILKLRSDLTYQLPGIAMDLLHLNEAIAAGSIWAEVKKQPDGHYSVYVYADEYASQYISKAENGKLTYPLVIENVLQENLGVDFFETILYHHTEGNFSQTFSSTAQGLLQSFDALKGVVSIKEKRADNQLGRTVEQFINGIIIRDEDPSLVSLEMQVEALVGFCGSYLVNGRLSFGEDPETEALASKLASVVEKSLEQQKSISADRRIAIEATLQEIRLALMKVDVVSEQDPMLLAKPIAEILRSSGVDKSKFRTYGDVIHTLIGDDLMDMVELALDSVDALPPQKTINVPAAKREVPLNLTPLQKVVRNFYFNIAFNCAKYSYFFFRALTSPIYYMYLLLPVVNAILPKQIVEFEQKCISTIQATLARLFTYALMRIFFSSDKAQGLIEAKQNLNQWVKSMRNPAAPTYALNPNEPEPSRKAFRIEHDWTHFSTEGFTTTTFDIVKNRLVIEPDGTHLFKEIERWVAQLESVPDSIFTQKTLMQAISTLPVPGKEGCMWRNIENPMEWLELLSKLAYKLEFKMELPGKEVLRSCMIAQHHLLAIMETIALNANYPDLEGFTVDGTLILNWMNSNACMIEDPKEVDYLESVAEYFSNKDKNINENNLFHHTYASTVSIYLSPAEQRYLKKLYESDLNLDEKISEILKLQSEQNAIEWKDCVKNDATIREVLAYMSHTLNDHATVIPRAYRILCRQARRASRMYINPKGTICDETYKWRVIPFNFFDRAVASVSSTFSEKYQERNANKSFYALSQYALGVMPDTLDPLNAKNGAYGWRLFETDLCQDLESISISQSEILSKEFSDERTRNIISNGELPDDSLRYICVERDDRIPRTIADFLQNQDRDYVIKWVFATIFQANSLKKLLVESPRFAETLGDFATKLMEHPVFVTQRNLVQSKLVMLYRYCKAYAPQYCSRFPDLIALIESDSTNPIDKAALKITILPKPDLYATPSEMEEYAETLCLLRFSDTPHQSESIFLEFLPEIEKCFQNRQFAWRLLKKILASYDAPVACDGFELMLVNDLTIQIPDMSLSIDVLRKKMFFEKVNELQFPHLKDLEDAKRKEYTLSVSRCPISFERIQTVSFRYENREYAAVNPEKVVNEGLASGLESAGYVFTDPILFWIDKSDNEERMLLVENSKDHSIICKVILRLNQDGSFTIAPKSFSDEQLIAVDDLSSLAFIGKFAPLNSVRAYRKTGMKHIYSFTVDGTLNFRVHEVDGQRRAVETTQFPDYYIAPNQDLPELRRYGAYLLLTNDKGERKVLVRESHLLHAGLWHITKHMQPFTHLIPASIFQVADKDKFFAYDIDGEGRLHSDDPVSIAHLLKIQMIQQDDEGIGRTITQFVDVAKRRQVEPSVWKKMMLLMLIPNEFRKTQKARMRFVAAMEENAILFQTKNDGEKGEFANELLLMYALWKDLHKLIDMSPIEKEMEGHGSLSQNQ
jgi:hypothetical protein